MVGMSSFTTPSIRTGFWTDWTSGAIAGQTLTLNPPWSSVFNSFIASFVFVIATAEWKMLNYFLHQIRASEDSQHGLSHQLQVGLRNAADPTGSIYTNLLQCWRWSKTIQGARTLCLALAAYNLLFAIAIPASAILSALVTSSASRVRLIRDSNCGIWINADSQSFLDTITTKLMRDTNDATTYARSCYVDTPDPLRCGIYPVPNLYSVLQSEAECPFSSEVCASKGASITSQKIDSHEDLGINAPVQDRLVFQKRTMCSLLQLQGFSTTTRNPVIGQTIPNTTVVAFSYGSQRGAIFGNYTWVWNSIAATLPNGYTMMSFSANAGVDDNWMPIPSLNRSDADVSIHFISGASILYSDPVDDPVFSAHDRPGQLAGKYISDHSVVPLGCVDQYQSCNPTNGVCSPWMGGSQILNTANEDIWPDHGMNLAQQATLARFTSLAPFLGTWSQVEERGAAALQIQEKVYQGRQIVSPVPANQWTNEMSGWFNTSMARLQQGILEFVVGVPAIYGGGRLLNLSSNASVNEALEQQCRNQIIRDTQSSVSFSVLGFALTFVVGGNIILLSWTLESIVVKTRRRWFPDTIYKSVQWTEDHVLHVQRRQYEAAGLGGEWTSCNSDIPATRTDIRFYRDTEQIQSYASSISEITETKGLATDLGKLSYERVFGSGRMFMPLSPAVNQADVHDICIPSGKRPHPERDRCN